MVIPVLWVENEGQEAGSLPVSCPRTSKGSVDKERGGLEEERILGEQPSSSREDEDYQLKQVCMSEVYPCPGTT